MSIFRNESDDLNINLKTEFDKIGVHVVRPYKNSSEWVFKHKENEYPLAPAGIVTANASPLILGADHFIRLGCEAKKILNPENGFNLLFSSEYFPTCDVKLKYKENFFDGYIYLIEPVNFLDVVPGQCVFMCSFVNFYYKTPPQELFLKAEHLS